MISWTLAAWIFTVGMLACVVAWARLHMAIWDRYRYGPATVFALAFACIIVANISRHPYWHDQMYSIIYQAGTPHAHLRATTLLIPPGPRLQFLFLSLPFPLFYFLLGCWPEWETVKEGKYIHRRWGPLAGALAVFCILMVVVAWPTLLAFCLSLQLAALTSIAVSRHYRWFSLLLLAILPSYAVAVPLVAGVMMTISGISLMVWSSISWARLHRSKSRRLWYTSNMLGVVYVVVGLFIVVRSLL